MNYHEEMIAASLDHSLHKVLPAQQKVDITAISNAENTNDHCSCLVEEDRYCITEQVSGQWENNRELRSEPISY